MVWERLQSLFFTEGEGSSHKKINKKLLILLGVGVFLLLFNSLFSPGERGAPPETINEREETGQADLSAPSIKKEKEMVDKLTGMINQIEGISGAAVYLTRESGPEKELAYDRDRQSRTTTEEDTEGGTREVEEINRQKNHVILREPEGGEKPLILVEHAESYRGAMVVAEGVQDTRKKKQVIKALESLLGLPPHRITVLPRGR